MLNPVSHPAFLNELKIFPSEFFPNHINVRYNKTMVGYKLLISYQFVFDVFFTNILFISIIKTNFVKPKKSPFLRNVFRACKMWTKVSYDDLLRGIKRHVLYIVLLVFRYSQ